eukprot:SAG31_NODE_1255_length_9082_cov_35.353668_6_plen_59_part_00
MVKVPVRVRKCSTTAVIYMYEYFEVPIRYLWKVDLLNLDVIGNRKYNCIVESTGSQKA